MRSLPRATGAAMWTQNRVQAAPVLVSKAHLELAQPQAVVINSGVANALTGERGELDALCTAAEAARLLDLDAEEVLVLSTGVIGAPLPLDRVRSGLVDAAAALSVEGGADAAEAILTTDTHAKTAVAHGPGFTVGGMAKGSGMIHPDLATMLAVVTTDYPLPEGEAIDFLRPAVDGSFNTISVDGECSTNDAVVLLSSGAAAVERTPASDEAFVLALRRVCKELAAQIVADGEGATLVAEIAVTGAASDAEARAIARRIATSPLVKTALFGRDANWGRILAAAGSAPYNGGYARVDAVPPHALAGTARRCSSHGAPQHVEPDVERRPGRDRARPRPRRRPPRATSRATSRTSTSGSTRSTAREPRRREGRRRRRGRVGRGRPRAGARARGVRRPRRGAADHGDDAAAAGCPVEFVGGRRVTTTAVLAVVRTSFETVNHALCCAIGPLAVPLVGDEIGLRAERVPGLGLVGDPLPSSPAAIEDALAAGRIPVVMPIAEGPLNVNADEAAAALALGLGAERLLFLTDVDGVILDGRVADAIDAAHATALLDGGSLEGGIVPKLRAATVAAREGVPATIGRTAVTA